MEITEHFGLRSRLSYECKKQKQNVFEKRNNHGKFKFVFSHFGIKLCFDERYQEGFSAKEIQKQLGLKRYNR